MPTRRLTGARIRERRLDQGLKQAAVAASVGISPSYLNLIEHNRRRIGGKLLSDLARVLGVDAALLTEGADSDLLDQMHAAAAAVGDIAEVARAEELAARYPGWAALIAAQARRLVTLEARVQALSDRTAHDPTLAASLHDVISSVTAIRSSASILVNQEELDADWQRRFHQNIHKDSVRLAASSEALVAYLDAPEQDAAVPMTAPEAADSFLAQTGFHLTQLERDPGAVEKLVTAAGLQGPAAPQLLRTACQQYVQDATALPLGPFMTRAVACGFEPAALAAHFHMDMAAVLRRLATLPAGGDVPPMGLVVCDAAGGLVRLKQVPGFTLPRAGGGCPLWPVYAAFSRPGQPIQAEVALPGPNPTRFQCYAVATHVAGPAYNAPPVLQSTMLVLPDPPEGSDPLQPVGVSCRICPRPDCAARREPAMQGVTPAATRL